MATGRPIQSVPELNGTLENERQVIKLVRAKFHCDNVEPSGDGFTAQFSAVTSGSEENDKFFDATPFGQLNIGTVRGDHFEQGKDYYLDFTLADEEEGSQEESQEEDQEEDGDDDE